MCCVCVLCVCSVCVWTVCVCNKNYAINGQHYIYLHSRIISKIGTYTRLNSVWILISCTFVHSLQFFHLTTYLLNCDAFYICFRTFSCKLFLLLRMQVLLHLTKDYEMVGCCDSRSSDKFFLAHTYIWTDFDQLSINTKIMKIHICCRSQKDVEGYIFSLISSLLKSWPYQNFMSKLTLIRLIFHK